MEKEIALKSMEFISLGAGYMAVALAAIGSSIGTGYAGADVHAFIQGLGDPHRGTGGKT